MQGTHMVPRCQVEGCKTELTAAKDYHCRHKVCEQHSKSPKVIVNGIEQRFCQQCSSFDLVHSSAFRMCIHVPYSEIPAITVDMVIAWIAAATLVFHIFLSWLFIIKLDMGLLGAAMTLNLATWLPLIGQFLYVICGGCPQTWSGLSRQEFEDLWPFVKLSVSSGVMLCLEFWYYRVLIVLTGHLADAEVAVDSLSICMNTNSLELMIPLGFLAATGVRIANELGAGNGKGAKFAMIVPVSTSSVMGIVFLVLILLFRQDFALVFTSSTTIIDAVSKLAILLAFTILLNSVQPTFRGSDWIRMASLCCVDQPGFLLRHWSPLRRVAWLGI